MRLTVYNEDREKERLLYNCIDLWNALGHTFSARAATLIAILKVFVTEAIAARSSQSRWLFSNLGFARVSLPRRVHPHLPNFGLGSRYPRTRVIGQGIRLPTFVVAGVMCSLQPCAVGRERAASLIGFKV